MGASTVDSLQEDFDADPPTNHLRDVPCLLEGVISRNRSVPAPPFQSLSPFDARKRPSISIEGYVKRLGRLMKPSASCFYVALAYVDRVLEKACLNLTNRNVHRMYFTALLLAVKLQDDHIYSNKTYAAISGMELSKVNYLEMTMLQILDFDLVIDRTEVDDYVEVSRGSADEPSLSACSSPPLSSPSAASTLDMNTFRIHRGSVTSSTSSTGFTPSPPDHGRDTPPHQITSRFFALKAPDHDAEEEASSRFISCKVSEAPHKPPGFPTETYAFHRICSSHAWYRARFSASPPLN